MHRLHIVDGFANVGSLRWATLNSFGLARKLRRSLQGDFEYKQAIVVRTDLRMGKGKIAAQVGHAVIMASEKTRKQRLEWWNAWYGEGQCKVVLRVSSGEELEWLRVRADALGLPTAKVEDRGLTQLEPGTVTCLGIGPAPADLVDGVTGELSLL